MTTTMTGMLGQIIQRAEQIKKDREAAMLAARLRREAGIDKWADREVEPRIDTTVLDDPEVIRAYYGD